MASLEIILEGTSCAFSEAEKLELTTEKNQYYVEAIAAMTPADLLPGVRPAIEALRTKGFKTALASGE